MRSIIINLFLLFILIVSSEINSETICIEVNDIEKDCNGEIYNGKYIKVYAKSKIYCCSGDVEQENKVEIVKSISLVDRLKKHFHPEVLILCDESVSNELKEYAEYISATLRECVINEVQQQTYKDISFDFLLKLELLKISKGFFRDSYVINNYENNSYSSAILQCNKKFIEGIGEEIRKTYELNRCSALNIYVYYLDEFIGSFNELGKLRNEVIELKKTKRIKSQKK